MVDQQDFGDVAEEIDTILEGCLIPSDTILTLYLTHSEVSDKSFLINLIPEDESYLYAGNGEMKELDDKRECPSS